MGKTISATDLKTTFHHTEAELLDQIHGLEEELAVEKESTAESNLRIAELEESNRQLTADSLQADLLAVTDELTQLPNLRALHIAIDRNVTRYGRSNIPCSILFSDVDEFTAVNNGLGHEMGNLAIKKLAEILPVKLKRTTDLVARYGGDEFVGVLENCSMENAAAVAQEIRRAIQEVEIELPDDKLPDSYFQLAPEERPHVIARDDGKLALKITISIGVVVISSRDDNAETLKKKADEALYEAKNQGRNCVCCYHAADSLIVLPRDEATPFEPRDRDRPVIDPNPARPA